MNTGITIGIIGILASIIGIPVTFIVARRARQRPELRHLIDFDVLLDPSDRLFDQGLYMKLEDHKIDSISRTRLIFWNRNGDTIRGSDILATDPLRLQFDEDNYPLQTRVICMSRKQTGLSATLNSYTSSFVNITFDFLDSNDGGLVEVVHQGTVKPAFLGTIRGSTIISAGSVMIEPKEILSNAQKSKVRQRIISITKNGLPLIGAFSALAFGSVSLWATLALSNFGDSNRLVNPSKFHLNTTDGQIAFVNAVMQTSYFNNPLGHAKRGFSQVFGIVILLIVAVSCVWTYIRRRKHIPFNIGAYHNIPKDEEDVQQMEPSI